MNDPLDLAILGASGRMGRQLVTLSEADPRFGSITPLDSGSDLGGIAHVDVLVDFSSAAGLGAALPHCRRHGVALVSGTTGLDADTEAALDAACADIALLQAANFSLGIAVVSRLLAQAARALPHWHLEIIEAHHAGKRDAPSGTALALGRAAAEARGHSLDQVGRGGRHGLGEARADDEIGFASLRAGDIVGEHNAILATAGERIELGHRATDRAIFARGALQAAAWLAGQGAGRCTLDDMLRQQGLDATAT